MADERSWCCFMIGEKGRAEKRAGEGREPQVGAAAPGGLAAVSGRTTTPPPPSAREVPDTLTGRRERDALLLLVPGAVFIIGGEAFNSRIMFCHHKKVTP